MFEGYLESGVQMMTRGRCAFGLLSERCTDDDVRAVCMRVI